MPDLITLLAIAAGLIGLAGLITIVVREVRATSGRRAYVGHHHINTVEIVRPERRPTSEDDTAVIEAVR